MGDFPFSVVSSGLALQAQTAEAGFALQNATPNIITWAVPNDGNLHFAELFAILHVTSGETGGQLVISVVIPDGTTYSKSAFGANQSAAVYTPFDFSCPQLFTVEPGSTVTFKQNSALTGGAALVWAGIWGL